MIIAIVHVNIRVPTSHFLSTNRYMFTPTIYYIPMIVKCDHCDVEAYYRFIIEDFNNVDSRSAELCLKCIRAEACKVDFPAAKFLKIEPLSFRQSDSISITEKM
jgi:hypothetical protein